jgi:hypothetical protein
MKISYRKLEVANFHGYLKNLRHRNICMPNISNSKKKSWLPLPKLFHRVTGNPKHTIIFVGLVCMYLLPHVCITIFLIYLMCETKLDSLLTDIKKIPSPPLPSLIMKTSEWEDMSLHSGTLMNIPIPSRPIFVLTP